MENIVLHHSATVDRRLVIALHLLVGAIQQPSNALRDIATLEIGSLQEAIVLRRGALAGKPQSIHVSA